MLVAALLACALVLSFRPEYPAAGLNYLFSTLAQVLASVFGFAFLVALAILQSLSAQSTRILFAHSTFWVVTLGYGSFYVITLLLSLVALKQPSALLADVLLGISAFALLMLPPYFVYLLAELTPQRLYSQLSSKALNARVNLTVRLDAVRAIHNLAMYAYHRGDYDSVDQATDHLLSLLGREADTNTEPHRFVYLSYRRKWLTMGGHLEPEESYLAAPTERLVLETLRRLLHIVTVPGNDPYIPILVMPKINRYGHDLVTSRRYQAVDELVMAEAVIAMLMAERLALDTVWWTIEFLRSSWRGLTAAQPSQGLPRYLVTDYLASTYVIAAAVTIHYPRLAPSVGALEAEIAESAGNEVTLDGVNQGAQFLQEVFPELRGA